MGLFDSFIETIDTFERATDSLVNHLEQSTKKVAQTSERATAIVVRSDTDDDDESPDEEE